MASPKRGCIVRSGKRHAKRNGRTCFLEEILQSKVLKFPPAKEDGQRFIHYCDYAPHQGLVLRPEVCQARGCMHYHKLPLSKESQVYETKKKTQ